MKSLYVISVLVMCCTCFAVDIPIINASFESPETSTWEGGIMDDWVKFAGSIARVVRPILGGGYNPAWDLATAYPGFSNQIGVVQSATLVQDIVDGSSIPVTYKEDSIYVFTLYSGGSYEGEGQTFFMKLATAGGTELAGMTITNHVKTFDQNELFYVTPSAGSPVGEQIRVQIQSGTWGGSAAFDMASLSEVPEPVSLAFMAIGSLFLSRKIRA